MNIITDAAGRELLQDIIVFLEGLAEPRGRGIVNLPAVDGLLTRLAEAWPVTQEAGHERLEDGSLYVLPTSEGLPGVRVYKSTITGIHLAHRFDDGYVTDGFSLYRCDALAVAAAIVQLVSEASDA